ncbi:hypothetical protein [Rhizobium leguminosarum]|uniref:hypothetical protein n=1 Tax=Rhizobium leguminosarum TaxID=384 RepID=UPI001C942FC0|nr:hypothetical protein [Rhizobium leguminosarum]
MATDMLAGSEDKIPGGILDLHALGRIADVEVGRRALYSSPAASYVTGWVLDVNGLPRVDQVAADFFERPASIRKRQSYRPIASGC